MKKKVFALVLVLALAMGLAACGSEAPKEEAAADSFVLGTIGPLTGENAIYGQAVANGAQVAVDEINAMGGVQFTLHNEDDVSDPETCVNAYHDLLDNGMNVLVGTTTTNCALEVSAHAYTDRVFMLTPSASSPDVTSGKDNVFQVCFTDNNQGSGSADFIADHNPDATIGVLYRSDDAFSQGVRDTFAAEAKVRGLNVAYEGTFTADTATNFEVQLTAARAAGVDLLFLPIYFQPASVILNQANAMDFKPAFFGIDGMDGILSLPNFDTSLAEGVMLLTPFSANADDEKTVKFVESYRKAYNDLPNQFAADAYDAVYIVKAAIEKSGVTPDMSTEEICDALLKIMPELSYDGLTGKGLTWSANGEVSKAPLAVIIENGQYQPFG